VGSAGFEFQSLPVMGGKTLSPITKIVRKQEKVKVKGKTGRKKDQRCKSKKNTKG